MTAIKPILRALVSWMEDAYGDPTQGADSEFAVELSSETLAMAELALAAAMNGNTPVLFATDAPVKSVIADLVLRRAGVTRAQVYQGAFSEEQFEALTEAVRTVKMSNLILGSPAGQVGTDAMPNR